MSWRTTLLVLLAALLAGVLGLLASVALYGSGPLLRSPLGHTAIAVLADTPKGVTVLLPGDTVSPFALPGLGGPARTLPTPGRVTLINYWASWCGPCREEMPLLDAYARGQAAGGVHVVGVALDDEAPALDYFRRGQFGFPSAVEASGDSDSSVRLGNMYGILPFSVLVAADGRIIDTHAGAFDNARSLQDWAATAP
jgi:thiol-disulfide isomerase/thioredoxin